MNKTSMFILMIFLFGLADNLFATSPMPEEAKPGQTTTVCVIRIVYMSDSEKGIPREDTSSTLTFEPSMSKENVLEKITNYLNNKLTEGRVSDFKLECEFPKT